MDFETFLEALPARPNSVKKAANSIFKAAGGHKVPLLNAIKKKVLIEEVEDGEYLAESLPTLSHIINLTAHHKQESTRHATLHKKKSEAGNADADHHKNISAHHKEIHNHLQNALNAMNSVDTVKKRNGIS